MLVTVLTAVTFLLHIFLPANELAVVSALNERNAVSDQIKVLNSQLLEKATQLDYSIRDGIDIKHQKDILQIEYDQLNNIYQRARADNRVFGFKSRHKFSWNFGLGLLITMLALDLMLSIKRYIGFRKKAKTFGALTGMTAAGYYNAWVFYPENDLPLNVYFFVLVLIGVLSAICAYYIVEVKRVTITRLKNDFLHYLKRLKHGEIRALAKTAIAKDLYDSAYQDELKKRTKAIDQSISNKAKSIIYETDDSEA